MFGDDEPVTAAGAGGAAAGLPGEGPAAGGGQFKRVGTATPEDDFAALLAAYPKSAHVRDAFRGRRSARVACVGVLLCATARCAECASRGRRSTWGLCAES